MRISLLAAAVAAVLLAASGAGAATVTVRVEGLDHTLVPQTAVNTTTAPAVKNGHSCSGTSAGGALDDATSGNWDGTYFAGFNDFLVNSIEGVAPPDPNDFWTLWVNNQSSQTGMCSTELQTGDSVLFFICTPDPNFACTNHPLVLTAPAATAAGSPFSVHVAQIADDGTSSPAAGVTVSGGGASGVTGADGNASLTVGQPGTASLIAAKPGLTTSAPATVSVGQPYSVPPPPPPPDRTPPLARITGIRNHQVFKHGHGPRTLHGTVASDPSGIKQVKLRLTRAYRRHCFVFSNRHARFARARCGASRAKFFSIGSKPSWSYLLPARLGPGRYVLDVTAIDGAGNRDAARVPGRNRMVFTVR